jgi:hypothetical protein
MPLYLADALLIQGRELNEPLASYRFGRGDWSRAGVPSRRTQDRPTPGNPLDRRREARPRASGTRHRSARNTGPATKEPKLATLNSDPVLGSRYRVTQTTKDR